MSEEGQKSQDHIGDPGKIREGLQTPNPANQQQTDATPYPQFEIKVVDPKKELETPQQQFEAKAANDLTTKHSPLETRYSPNKFEIKSPSNTIIDTEPKTETKTRPEYPFNDELLAKATVQEGPLYETKSQLETKHQPEAVRPLDVEVTDPMKDSEIRSRTSSNANQAEGRERAFTFGAPQKPEEHEVANQMNASEIKPQPNVGKEKLGFFSKIVKFFISFPEIFHQAIKTIAQLFSPNEKGSQEAGREEELTRSQAIAQQNEIEDLRQTKNGNFHPGKKHHEVTKEMLKENQRKKSQMPVGKQSKNPHKSTSRSAI